MILRVPNNVELTDLVNCDAIKDALGIPEGDVVLMHEYYSRPGNIAFICKQGGMLFPWVEDGVYECHFLFYPGASGRQKLEAARAMLEEMFTNRGAHVIRGFPPRENRAVRVIGNALGFQKIPDAIRIDGLGRECETYEMRRTNG